MILIILRVSTWLSILNSFIKFHYRLNNFIIKKPTANLTGIKIYGGYFHLVTLICYYILNAILVSFL